MSSVEPDPITYAKQTLRDYFNGLNEITPPPVQAMIAGEELADTVQSFQAGEIEAEQVIRGAITICVQHAERISGSAAARTLERFSYTFGALAGIDDIRVHELWRTSATDDRS